MDEEKQQQHHSMVNLTKILHYHTQRDLQIPGNRGAVSQPAGR